MGRRLVTSSPAEQSLLGRLHDEPPRHCLRGSRLRESFSQAPVILGSYPRAIEHTHHPRIRANRTHIQVVRQVVKEQVVGAAATVDKPTGSRNHRKRVLRNAPGAAADCTNERFCNPPALDGLLSGLGAAKRYCRRIRLAIALCEGDRTRSILASIRIVFPFEWPANSLDLRFFRTGTANS